MKIELQNIYYRKWLKVILFVDKSLMPSFLILYMFYENRNYKINEWMKEFSVLFFKENIKDNR